MKREELEEKIKDLIECEKHPATTSLGAELVTIEIMSWVDEYTKPKKKTKSLEERAQIFFRDVLDVAEEVGTYSCDMVQDFMDYWTEHGKNDKKMRFEKQKSFGIKRRLATWKRNQKNYNNGTTTTKTDAANEWLNS